GRGGEGEGGGVRGEAPAGVGHEQDGLPAGPDQQDVEVGGVRVAEVPQGDGQPADAAGGAGDGEALGNRGLDRAAGEAHPAGDLADVDRRRVEARRAHARDPDHRRVRRRDDLAGGGRRGGAGRGGGGRG